MLYWYFVLSSKAFVNDILSKRRRIAISLVIITESIKVESTVETSTQWYSIRDRPCGRCPCGDTSCTSLHLFGYRRMQMCSQTPRENADTSALICMVFVTLATGVNLKICCMYLQVGAILSSVSTRWGHYFYVYSCLQAQAIPCQESRETPNLCFY